MSVFSLKRWYILLIVGLFALGIFVACHSETNIFAEIGASIVVISIARGMKEIRGLQWSAQTLSQLASEGQKMALKWDASAAMVGTATNGFSVWLFALSRSW